MAFDQKKVLLIGLLFVVIFVGIIYTLFRERGDDVTTEGPTEPGWFTDPSLKFVVVIFRHGDRAPIFQFKTNPHANAFPEGIGELTKKGKQHMYKKGQILRRMYNGFISDLYSDDEILIKSTYTKRTHMSAQMVVAGMYPPKSYQKWSNSETIWQPIPVYTNSPDHGTLFVDGTCPYFDSISNKMLLKFANNCDKNITVPLLEYLTEKCDQQITVKTLFKLYDLFVCQMSEGLPLPEWINHHHIEEMKSIVTNKTNVEEFYRHSIIQKLIIGPLLTEIGLSLEFYKNNSNYNTTRKMHLYAGHDITLTTIMSFLGKIIETPDFGASLHFHLYYDDTIGYNIKVFYYNQWDNEKGEEVSIFNCQKPCKIQDFKKLWTNLSVNWDEECQKVDTEN